MKKTEYIILLHDLEENNSLRIDFTSEMKPNNLIKSFKLEGYGFSQFIQNECLVEISEIELRNKKIKFEILPRTKKTWFGLSAKEVNDILIVQTEEFIYPYNYGHFVYYFSKKVIGKAEIKTWISKIGPNIFMGLDDIYSGRNNYETQLINKDDYVIVTNHDLQHQFGISANSNILGLLTDEFANFEIDNVEYEKYNQQK